MRLVITGILAAGMAAAAPLEVGSWQGGAPWRVPGGGEAVCLAPGKAATLSVTVPELTEKETKAGCGWRGVLEVDGYGTIGGGEGSVVLEALDPATGEVFASGATKFSGAAPRAACAVIASSENGGDTAAKAFDGDPKTDWHTRYGGNRHPGPHWIGLEFGSVQKISGIDFLPRQGGYTNGVPRKWGFEVRRPGVLWERVAEGESSKEVADKRVAVKVRLPEPLEVLGFRFVVDKDWGGGGFGTCGEITVLDFEMPEEGKPVDAGSRAWLELPGELMEKLVDKTFGLRVKAGKGESVVVGAARFARVSTEPGKKLFGRSNGGLGPDKLGAGLLGFDGMTEHKQTVLPVMEVRDRSPAKKAGLKKGDLIVEVNGKPLPVNDLAPGFNWFERSHEAVIGRESETVLKNHKRDACATVGLGVLREGKVEQLDVELQREAAFSSMNPADDKQAAVLLEDMLKFVEDTQREDGSWSKDIKRTTFAALALMATREKKHRSAVKKAVEWSLEKHPEPAKYGNLGFWSGGYAGTLYSEWYLATGDKKVLPYLDALRDWAVAGQHTCKWDVPALGHGPSGLPYGEKSLVAPSCHLLVHEALAKRCGIKSEIWELLFPYMEMSWSDPKDGGHGALGYNRSYKDLGEFFSRSGLFAMAAHLRGERPDMRDAMTKIMEERHPWIRNSHAYGEPGGSWGLLGLNLAAPERYARVVKGYAWWFSLAWEPGYGLRFTTPHMGAPYMGEDDLINVTYALVLQGPKKSLHLTGATDKGWW